MKRHVQNFRSESTFIYWIISAQQDQNSSNALFYSFKKSSIARKSLQNDLEHFAKESWRNLNDETKKAELI